MNQSHLIHSRYRLFMREDDTQNGSDDSDFGDNGSDSDKMAAMMENEFEATEVLKKEPTFLLKRKQPKVEDKAQKTNDKKGGNSGGRWGFFGKKEVQEVKEEKVDGKEKWSYGDRSDEKILREWNKFR